MVDTVSGAGLSVHAPLWNRWYAMAGGTRPLATSEELSGRSSANEPRPRHVDSVYCAKLVS